MAAEFLPSNLDAVPESSQADVNRTLCHRRNTSSLSALDILSPPSPPLTPSDVLSSSTSGEIPIIFALDFLTTNPSREKLDFESGLGVREGDLKPNINVPPLAKFSPISAFFPMGNRLDTMNTIGTSAFGFKLPSASDDQRLSITGNNGLLPSAVNTNFGGKPQSPPKSLEILLNGSPSMEFLSTALDGPNEHEPADERTPTGNESHFTISAYLASPSIYRNSPSALASSRSEPRIFCSAGKGSTLNTSQDDRAGATRLSLDELEDTQPSRWSSLMPASRSLSTIQFASLTPTSSYLESPFFSPPRTPVSANRTPTQATFLRRQSHVKSAPRPFAHQDSQLPGSNGYPMRTSSSASEVESQRRFGELEEKYIPISTLGSPRDGQDRPIFRNVRNFSPATTLPIPCLKHAQWLRDTVIELWIDQEGFRAIRPKFVLASVNHGLPSDIARRLSGEDDSLFMTVAEFLPVSRETHFFHHATLDRMPTLHRVTTNGDEGRDYITRQASLVLRDNGVFYVHGTEDHRLTGTGRVVRLNWRFEYFVADRRPGPKSTRVHSGEKTFKPLSFSCTPALLAHERASKVKVLHIMKKTILPNLMAQKLEPPDLPPIRSLPSSSSVVSITSEPRSPRASPKAASHYGSSKKCLIGRRSRKGSVFECPNPTILTQISPPRPPFPYTKPRRGSLSETRDSIVGKHSTTHPQHERSKSASYDKANCFPVQQRTPAKTCFIRPIIPREELSRIFDSDSEEQRRPHSARLGVVNNTQITILPPAPRPRPTGF